MLISKLEDFVMELKNNLNVKKNSIYSQIIKGERIRNNMTLEEVARGICSISYLSKLENQILVPSKEYVYALLERMNIDYNDVEKLELTESLELCIKYYMYYKKDYLIELYDSLGNITFNSAFSLIKCFKHLVNEEFEEFKNEIAILDEIKSCINGLEALTLIFLVNEYYCITFQFENVYTISKCIEILDVSNEYLNFMFLEQFYKASYFLENHQRLNNLYYETILSRLPMGYPIKRKAIIKMMHISSRANEFSDFCIKETKRFDMEIEDLKSDFDVMYYKYLIMAQCKLYVDVYKDIVNNCYYVDTKFLALLGYCAYMLNRDEVIMEFKKRALKHDFDDYDKIHNVFIHFLLNLYGSERATDKIIYFRKEVLSYNKAHYHLLYSQVYFKYYVYLLKKTSRYKDATLFLEQNKIN